MIYLHQYNKSDIDQRVEIFLCSLPSKEAIYISGAITTGKDYVNWYTKQGKLIECKAEFKTQHYNDVIEKNMKIILQFADGVRSIENDVIIEPASFEMPGWSQDDYLYYWGEIINKCVIKIIFLDGWCYSKGCTFEYYTGLKKGIELIDQNQKSIEISWAIEHIQKAIAEYNKVGINTDLQQKLVKEIEYECR